MYIIVMYVTIRIIPVSFIPYLFPIAERCVSAMAKVFLSRHDRECSRQFICRVAEE